jgi:rhodanese-related sulfurtransferase
VVTRGNIDARTLRDMLESGERVTVVDVRKSEDHASDSIPGSVSFDAYDALHAGDERAMESLQLPEEARVVTVCNRGHSSAVAAEQLRRRGHEAFSLEDGMEAWKSL